MSGPEADFAVFHAPTPNGLKITICLEEMGLPYRIIPVRLGSELPEGFLSASPNGKIPALVGARGPGVASVALFESATILLYLAEKPGQFLDPEPAGRYAVIQWLIWQVAAGAHGGTERPLPALCAREDPPTPSSATVYNVITPIAIQSFTPPQLRARIVSLNFLTTSVLGYGLGPLAAVEISTYMAGGNQGPRIGLIALSIITWPLLVITTFAVVRNADEPSEQEDISGDRGDHHGAPAEAGMRA
ncbi:MAG: glutathione S-transferase N-terminal domain-containing protein [Sphingobium sp.]